MKGHVQIKWYGESNGYYSESVEFEKIRGGFEPSDFNLKGLEMEIPKNTTEWHSPDIGVGFNMIELGNMVDVSRVYHWNEGEDREIVPESLLVREGGKVYYKGGRRFFTYHAESGKFEVGGVIAESYIKDGVTFIKGLDLRGVSIRIKQDK